MRSCPPTRLLRRAEPARPPRLPEARTWRRSRLRAPAARARRARRSSSHRSPEGILEGFQRLAVAGELEIGEPFDRAFVVHERVERGVVRRAGDLAQPLELRQELG